MFDWKPRPDAAISLAGPHAGEPAVDPATPEQTGPRLVRPLWVAPSAFRAARVRAMREAVSNGRFETEERIRGTVERLLDVLRHG